VLLAGHDKGRRQRLLRLGMDQRSLPPRIVLGSTALVWLLGLSQIVGYGTMYYSFSILAADIAGGLGWPVAWLWGSFSLALLAGGLVAPLVGQRIDRHGAGLVMAVGSGLSAVTLLAAATAPNAIVFSIALVAMQAASAMVFYDAAFAALVQATGSQAGLRITHLTLIAGFASTISWPLTSWLHGVLGWREILMAFALANVAVCLPIHALIATQRRRLFAASAVVPADELPVVDEVTVPAALHRRVLWLVTIGFALSGFALSAMLTEMVPMLTALGLGGSALVVSTLFGPAQVLVRFVNMLIGLRRHPMLATLIGLGMLPLAILLLMASAPLTLGAVAFAVLLGFGSGLKSIVQGTLPLALFGSASYGARLGYMAMARQGLAAVAPFVLAVLVDSAGPRWALLAIATAAALGLAAMLAVARINRRPAEQKGANQMSGAE
jgi:MFS family permease